MTLESHNNDWIKYNLDNKLNPELKRFLDDKILDSDEAKALIEIFDTNKIWLLDISKENLEILRLAIGSSKTISHITSTEKRIIKKISELGIEDNNRSDTNNYILNEEQNVDITKTIIEETSDTVIKTKTVGKREIINSDIEGKRSFSERDILRQSKKLNNNEIKILQAYLWFSYWKWLDGIFWKGSFKKYSENNSEWSTQTLSLFIEENKDNLDKFRPIIWYWILWWPENEYNPWEAEKEFRIKYWEFVSKISNNLELPNWILESIIKKETNFGEWVIKKETWLRRLNSGTWSKGMMQLTIWPFKDMAWDYSYKNNEWKVIKVYGWDKAKVKIYRSIFKKIDFEELKSIDMWDWKKIRDTLTSDIWEKLSNLQNDNTTSDDAIKIIKELRNIIKSPINEYDYFHTLNMIIWSVYYKYLYNRVKWNEKNKIIKAAENYNWDEKVYDIKKKNLEWNVIKIKWAKMEKVLYAKKVYKYFLKENRT